MIYLAGSLKNAAIPQIAIELRQAGFDVFDEWYSAGPEADDHFQAHCLMRGMSYREALDSPHARTVFDFDRTWIDRASTFVLAMPAGKSAHMELGYACGSGIRTAILLDGDPERFDVMHLFADFVVSDVPALCKALFKCERGK